MINNLFMIFIFIICFQERRKERKTNTEAFKEERKYQEKMLESEKKCIQGNKIF